MPKKIDLIRSEEEALDVSYLPFTNRERVLLLIAIRYCVGGFDTPSTEKLWDLLGEVSHAEGLVDSQIANAVRRYMDCARYAVRCSQAAREGQTLRRSPDQSDLINAALRVLTVHSREIPYTAATAQRRFVVDMIDALLVEGVPRTEKLNFVAPLRCYLPINSRFTPLEMVPLSAVDGMLRELRTLLSSE